MPISTKRKVVLWSLWISIVPVSLFFVYHTYPPPEMNAWNLLAYVLFFVVACLMPMNINGSSAYLVQWATVAVFLKYGIFAEILFSQLTVLIVTLRSRTAEPLSFRIPFNSLMFYAASLLAGIAFYAAGGQVGSLQLTHILAYGFIFQFVSFLANQLIFYFYDKSVGANPKFFSIDVIWDFAITLLVFPYALAIYISESYIGIPALLLLGIPFFIMTAIMKLYNSSEKINIDLKKAGEIGHQLAARLSTDEVLDQFVLQVADLFKADYAYVLDYRDNQLQMLRMFENNELLKNSVPPVRYNQGVGGKVVTTNKAIIYNRKSEWKDIVTGHLPIDSESIMAVPIARNNKTEGVLILGSRQKYAFTSRQLQILDILSTYFAVSLEKASYVERAIAISERCGLTKLYNYRYLDAKLEKSMKKITDGELNKLSLVMMDIDRFKGINDQYGHQSGNDILVQLARIIEEEVGEEGTCARYGGEEFVVLLPNYGKDLALLFAENLRKRIESHPFEIISDLDSERKLQKIQITLSIGVSTAPEDSDDGMALIRNADRALYIGAKQAGRNKVAAYAK
ncbi:sensor domain-containing diguanylate cyclase [Planomicrobium sp. CPCC 101079]|uniref:sensor domain-containing diguanylate cyclase n=1 Tax=Planomicrobium sp. CPCC 101079 TaxID=2599618 RepID=UPI0011B63AAB|nr:sensor domain-containing diguanylate cyclase [Planomicrobium sp. CPCC 101079]TWT09009.1 GGDEF domain-containing protein [Planomicrobium sp. CPCC 101079]